MQLEQRVMESADLRSFDDPEASIDISPSIRVAGSATGHATTRPQSRGVSLTAAMGRRNSSNGSAQLSLSSTGKRRDSPKLGGMLHVHCPGVLLGLVCTCVCVCVCVCACHDPFSARVDSEPLTP